MKSGTNQNTILSSYLPMKNYIVSNANRRKPVKQLNREKRTFNTAISGCKRAHTSKNSHGQMLNETFDDFVQRMKKQSNMSSETYEFKARTYTSSEYNHLRIKHHKRPMTKSGINGKR